MYRVSIELQKHEWKFGRTRNAVGTQEAGECFHSFFEFTHCYTTHYLSQIIVYHFTTKVSPISSGLNWSRDAIVFIRGGTLSAHFSSSEENTRMDSRRPWIFFCK